MQASEARPGLGYAIVSAYERAMRFAAGSMMATIVIIMITQVTARYVFNSSLIWAEELCRYILIWMTFLLLGMSYQKGEFISLEMLPETLSLTARRVTRIVMSVPTLFFLALMTWAGWTYAARFDNQTIPALDFIWESIAGGTLNISIRWVYVSVSVGSALLFLHIFVDLLLRAGRLWRGEPDSTKTPPDSGEIA
ncbi:TRAP-type C4-dicarboxylate transport system permease small subunit [Hoeflea marina]|uniref:TRAP transporter small permease protein n=1 Tax=Hoeflea marina TaxID=274592 RepID=A0A317PCG3_9HYPH|nr:TRAP transporter small permease [Hoeflea marina]PWV97107.1 TRAP-type C4-dicarboxylate transport system permease small subunit [Hoeflea marina]